MNRNIVFAAGILVGASAFAFTGSVKLLDEEKNTISVFQVASKSVVSITTKVQQQNWFTMDIEEVERGGGSGFVWDKEGHIVTNFHVVENADAWMVTLSDHSNYPAELVGVDPSKDTALLRIKAPSARLVPMTAGASDQLQVGQKVLAIGNPFGLDQTLTSGIVSALGRSIGTFGNRTIRDVIQTDASINPGNSGGPLLDSQGNLIGMNTAIKSPSGASVGIGFAIPVNTIKRVVPELIKYRKVIRPGLGINPVSDAVARNNGIQGVIIEDVVVGTGADKAGLKGVSRTRRGELLLGDYIVSIEGSPVKSQSDLFDALEKYKVGDTISLTVVRNGKKVKANVVLQRID